MSKLADLFNPSAATESSGKREGIILVRGPGENKVVKSDPPKNPKPGDVDRGPYLAMCLNVVWLDTVTQQPMIDPVSGSEQEETIMIGYGSSSLGAYHPGQAENPGGDQADVTDCGGEVGAAGNTIYIHDLDKAKVLNVRSSFTQWAHSLQGAGWKNVELLTWGPAYEGAIFEVVTHVGAINPKDGKTLPPMRELRAGESENAYRRVKRIIKTNLEEMEAAKDPIKAAGTPEEVIQQYIVSGVHNSGDKISLKAFKAKVQGAASQKLKLQVVKMMNDSARVKAAIEGLATVEGEDIVIA